MICPGCGFEVDDGLLACPFCDADLTATSPIHAARARWCTSCGSLVDAQEMACPVCGAAQTDDFEDVSGIQGRERPNSLPRLSSALPDDSEDTDLRSSPALARRYILAVVAGIIAIICVVGFVWHPWAPDPGKTNEPKPGAQPGQPPMAINTLAGQDFRESTSTRLGAQGLRTTYEWTHDAYEILIGLAARVSANWSQLDSVVDGTYAQSLDVGRDEANSILQEIDTLHQDISDSFEGEDYLNQVAKLMDLVDLLRTCSEGVLNGWDAAASADEDARVEAITQAMEASGAYSASQEFIDAYQEWEISH